MEQIQAMQGIADTASVARVKQEAIYQKDIWEQVLEKDSININNPSNEVIRNTFDLEGKVAAIGNNTALSLSTTDSYNVSHFIDASIGASLQDYVWRFGCRRRRQF